MRRLCIVSVYDDEGYIDEYLKFYLGSLSEVATRIVIVVNGKITNEGKTFLERKTKDVIIRDNVGLDAGAYKYILCNYLTEKELMEYDELILTNDTCFGPFIPFRNIFEDMSEKNVDFWGINFINYNIYCYLQSNFLVFTERVFHEVYTYFGKNIDENTQSKHQVCMQFERGLFKYLIDLEYTFGVYAHLNTVDCYSSPYQLIKEYGYPFLKKRAFEIGYERNRENFAAAIDYIKINYSYNISMITQWLKRKKYNNVQMRGSGAPLYAVHYNVPNVVENDILDFCKRNPKVYIYGAGLMAEDIYSYYKSNFTDFQGFVVSNDVNKNQLFGYSIIKRSEMPKEEYGILVCANKKNSQEIREILGENKNILYIW